METRYLKEYNLQGELIFIVDKKTAKGFHVKNNSESINVESAILKKIDSNFNGKDISKSYINRLTTFKHIANPSRLSKILVILYWSLLLVLLSTGLSGTLNLSVQNINQSSNGEFFKGMKGLFIFLLGVFFIHEFSHVLVARLQGIFIKKIGFRLRYLVFPIFFVRVFPTSNRQKKINIAFVGLVSDLFLLLFYNTLFIITDQTVFQYALNLQLLMTFFNYNILLPTDFTNSILFYFNFGNFRNEAFEYSKNIFKRNTSIYKQASKIKRIVYVLYTLLFTTLWILVLLNLVNQIIKVMKMR
ncbi:hypothetical protein IGI37_000248 [Enterococcus sp. AZ194]|uniref:hypothetical protein n=1 Tax=Enterococcus sp. AZ194 TaxID=2774629 RepID=UPI003F20214C